MAVITELANRHLGDMWATEFGRSYTKRNDFTLDELDTLYLKNYGVTRPTLNEKFLRDIPRDAHVLEVGCNVGTQLRLLHNMGFQYLSGIDIQQSALEIAHKRAPYVDFRYASAECLPYADGTFDLVFTSGLLIHIPPSHLHIVMGEIHRVTRRWIWGLEYWSDCTEEIAYRGHDNLLWKMDYANKYQQLFPNLKLVKEKKLAYLGDANADSMFFLEKLYANL